MGHAEMTTRRRLHPVKRRKLVHSESPITISSPSPTLPTDVKSSVCNSCRRAFPGAKRNQLVQCARCLEPTCAICSRVCNGCLPSMPPTPALTASPSSGPDTPLLSPHRPPSELSVNMPDALGEAAPLPLAGRRRKVRDLDQDDEFARMGEGEGGCEAEGGAEGVLPGCGRTVCQTCSFETPASDLTTCLDCAARYKSSE